MPSGKQPFPSEVSLCATFISCVDKRIWTPYAETAGWDILLVRKADGFQIGIEAKLKLNIEVVNQTLEEYGYIGVDREGPDARAVLVPFGNAAFARVAAYIGFTIITQYADGPYQKAYFHPYLPKPNDHYSSRDDWHEWAPVKRCQLPEYVPDVAAGAPSPIQLTAWKISALKLQATLEKNGYVTRSDFRYCGLDHRRWIARESGWLVLDAKSGGYIRGPRFPNFAAGHPKVYEQVKADLAKVVPEKMLV